MKYDEPYAILLKKKRERIIELFSHKNRNNVKNANCVEKAWQKEKHHVFFLGSLRSWFLH